MKISEHFDLGRGQGALDFIDVKLTGDTNAYVEPRAIRRIESEWYEGCVGLLQNFFEHVLTAVREDDRAKGLNLLQGLSEPNETHLGLSKGRPRGSSLGPELVNRVWERLRQSEAAKSGLLHDLEETALVIRGIEVDRISDITTNIIRQPLIDYTQEMAKLYAIPLEQLDVGQTWNPETGGWNPNEYGELPPTPVGPLLLVPKVIVRARLDFNSGQYFNGYILEAFREKELAAGTGLVHTLKNGKKKVYKKDVRKKYFGKKSEKTANEDATLDDPKLLEQYRADKRKGIYRDPPLSFSDFAKVTGGEPPDWDALLADVVELPAGGADAAAFHRAAEALLTTMFYPSLTEPKLEAQIDEGRKRVDIRYANTGIGGFFGWVQQNYKPQPFCYVECKNYTADLGNDALDQIAGRFGKLRGNFGLLVCRSFKNKTRFIQRCRDTAMSGKGFVIVLDDQDLAALVQACQSDNRAGEVSAYLRDRLAEIV